MIAVCNRFVHSHWVGIFMTYAFITFAMGVMTGNLFAFELSAYTIVILIAIWWHRTFTRIWDKRKKRGMK